MKHPTRTVALLCALLLALAAAPVRAATYYVSPSGNDAAAGTSAATAWQTIAKVNAVAPLPGDSILFQGGQTFAGTVRPRGPGGTAAAPVTIGSYGTGQATIAPGADFGIYAYNCGGLHVDNLIVAGTISATADSAMQDGIRLEANAAGVAYGPVSVTNCDVSGFYRSGVLVMQDLANSTFASSTITGNNLHGNGFSGLYTWASDTARLAHLYVAGNAVHDNAGDLVRTSSGSGIIIAETTGATVEHNVAYGNGVTGKGGCGIWGYSSDHLTIQYNVSAHNRTNGSDGDGFDLDDGTSSSVLQYNVSSDNDGGGYLFCQWHDLPVFTGNAIRYNVSSGDGIKNGYGAVHVWGRVTNSQVYNNTLIVVPSAGNSAFHANNATLPTLFASNVAFRDNLVLATAPGSLAVNYEAALAAGSTNVTFGGNLYRVADGSAASFAWAGKTYAGLPAFRAGSLQEGGAGIPTGSVADPLLTGPVPLSLPAVLPVGMDPAATAAPVVPVAGSPALTAGLTAAAAGLTPPATDLFGGAIAAATADHVGAAATASATTAAPTTSPAIVTTVPPAVDGPLTGTVLGTAGSYENLGNTAAKAFDGSLATYFDGPTANGCWVGLDLGSARTITSLGFAPRVQWESRMVGGVFAASNAADFSTTVAMFTVTTVPVSGKLTTVAVPASIGPVRYVRYLAPAGSYGNIAELQLAGH